MAERMEHSERGLERVGHQIAGRYRLLRLLGAGGMGAVYEALHEFTQRRVAVKLMHPHFARSAQAAERFIREARAPSSIGHPGIVEVLDGGRADDGSLYLVLELLEGETLAARMRDRPMSPAELAMIAIELLDALQAAHAAGFVHRDIKPENVFLVPNDDGTESVILLDFGVASVSLEDRPGLTQAGAVLGTPLYMSPEQALGRRVDARSDLWSVGAVCYQALTGTPPFKGTTVQGLIISIATQEHLPLSVVSPDLPLRVVKVVERALHKQADKRWQSAAEMADGLRQAIGGARDARTRMRDAASQQEADLPPIARSLAEAAGQPVQPVVEASSPVALRLGVAGVLALLGIAAVIAVRQPHAQPASSATGAIGVVPVAEPSRPPSAPATTAANVAPSPQSTTPRAAEPSAEPAPATAATTPEAPQTPTPSAEPAAPRTVVIPAPSKRLDSGAVSEVLRAHDGELQRCYEDAVVAALLKQGSQPGADPEPIRLDAEIEISAAGEVREVNLRGAAPDAMLACARTAIRAWRFPAAGEPTSVRVPMVFQPSIVRQ